MDRIERSVEPEATLLTVVEEEEQDESILTELLKGEEGPRAKAHDDLETKAHSDSCARAPGGDFSAPFADGGLLQ